MLQIALDKGPFWLNSVLPECHRSLPSPLLRTFMPHIGDLDGDHGASAGRLTPVRLPLRHTQAGAHIVAAFPPIVAGEGVTPEAARRIGIDQNRQTAVILRMVGTGCQDSIASDVSA